MGKALPTLFAGRPGGCCVSCNTKFVGPGDRCPKCRDKLRERKRRRRR